MPIPKLLEDVFLLIQIWFTLNLCIVCFLLIVPKVILGNEFTRCHLTNEKRENSFLWHFFWIYPFSLYVYSSEEEIGIDKQKNMISLYFVEQMLYYFSYNMYMLIFYVCSILIIYHMQKNYLLSIKVLLSSKSFAYYEYHVLKLL